MNTKTLMTSSSLTLAVAGIFTLFAPNVLLSALGVAVTAQLAVFVQLLGALYFSFALMNWTAKDSAIGDVGGRRNSDPVGRYRGFKGHRLNTVVLQS